VLIHHERASVHLRERSSAASSRPLARACGADNDANLHKCQKAAYALELQLLRGDALEEPKAVLTRRLNAAMQRAGKMPF